MHSLLTHSACTCCTHKLIDWIEKSGKENLNLLRLNPAQSQLR